MERNCRIENAHLSNFKMAIGEVRNCSMGRLRFRRPFPPPPPPSPLLPSPSSTSHPSSPPLLPSPPPSPEAGVRGITPGQFLKAYIAVATFSASLEKENKFLVKSFIVEKFY